MNKLYVVARIRLHSIPVYERGTETAVFAETPEQALATYRANNSWWGVVPDEWYDHTIEVPSIIMLFGIDVYEIHGPYLTTQRNPNEH